MRECARRLAASAVATLSVVVPLVLSGTGRALADAGTATVTVPADARAGIATVTVQAGDTLVFTGSGSARYGTEGSQPCVGDPFTHPDGSRFLGGINCGPKDDPNATLPGAAIGLLIARIGSGSWFAVGTGSTIARAAASGEVYLAYNDSVYSDNTGSYSATIDDEGFIPGDGGDHCPTGCTQ